MIEHGGLIYWSELYDSMNNEEYPSVGIMKIDAKIKDESFDIIWFPLRNSTGIRFDYWEEVDLNMDDVKNLCHFIESLTIYKNWSDDFLIWLNRLHVFLKEALENRKSLSVCL